MQFIRSNTFHWAAALAALFAIFVTVLFGFIYFRIDDYLTKPFAVVELIARIEALLRRPAESRETTLRVGPLEVDLIERTVKRGDRAIELLPREFRLLEYMMRRSDQLLTRAMLLEEVWNYKFVPATNLVDVHMGRVRHKVDGPGDAPMIHNVRGAGFILRAVS